VWKVCVTEALEGCVLEVGDRVSRGSGWEKAMKGPLNGVYKGKNR
jgi:hypothetical protein